MDYKVVMPRLSDSMDEGMLVDWKIKPGDRVKNGDVIAEVESDKAVMEIQTFKSGVVTSLLVDAGTVVPVGTGIAVIDTDAAGAAEAAPVKKAPEIQHPAAETKPAEAKAAPQQAADTPKPAEPETEPPKTETVPSSPNIVDIILGKEISEAIPSSFSGGNASPRARASAAQYGLDIDALQKEGALPVPAHFDDIKRYYIHRYFTPKALELIAKYHLATDLFETGKKHDEAEIKAYIQTHEIPLPEPLDIVKRSMIAMLSEAAKKPIYHMSDTLDARLFERYESKEATVTVWLLKLFAEAMMRHRSFRMTLDTDTVQVWPNANISLAMAEGELLYMPVFKSLNKKSVAEIAQALQQYKSKLKARRLSQDDLTGSTFGISNLGMTGVAQFDAMINKNDCAIAAIGAQVQAGISVTLTVDHRIVNGYQAAQFMQELKALAADEMFFKEAAK